MWERLPGVTAAAGVLAAYLAVGLPLSGLRARREMRRLTREPGLRLTVYRQTISRLWLLAGVTIAITGLAKLPLSTLGLRVPRLASAAPLVLIAAALLVVAVATARARQVGRGAAPDTANLLPVTRRERRIYVGVALSAGAVEELLFRGFLVLYLTGALGWSAQAAVAASALAFGISHLYQGIGTAVAAGVIGYGFAETYVMTGSLLVPVVVHAALDLRVLCARAAGPDTQKCSGASALSSRSPMWNTNGDPGASTPSPSTNSNVGAVVDA